MKESENIDRNVNNPNEENLDQLYLSYREDPISYAQSIDGSKFPEVRSFRSSFARILTRCLDASL